MITAPPGFCLPEQAAEHVLGPTDDLSEIARRKAWLSTRRRRCQRPSFVKLGGMVLYAEEEIEDWGRDVIQRRAAF